MTERDEVETPMGILRTVLREIEPFPPGATVAWDRALGAVRSAGRESGNAGSVVGEESPIYVPDLVPSAPSTGRADLTVLKTMSPSELLVGIVSAPDAVAVKAGLLLLSDDLDSSHALSQSIEGEGRHTNGDYWHGIMHRREPDYSNAKYWFRRVGRHPVFKALAETAQTLLDGSPDAETSAWSERLNTETGWDPFAFVDLCAACEGQDGSALTAAARSIQLIEMLLLFKQSADDALAA